MFQKIWAALLISLLLIAIVPVSAQESAHTGVPEIIRDVVSEPVLYAIPPCDRLYGYDHVVQIMLLSKNNIYQNWYDDDGLRVYGHWTYHEMVTLTAIYPDGSFGKSVNLKLDFTSTMDYITGINTMSGIRSAIIHPDGSLEPVNYGYIELFNDTGYFANLRGTVLDSSGNWDAVVGDWFDHIRYACSLVAD